MIFLHNVSEIEELCKVENYDNQKAGEAFPNEAHAVLCGACRRGSESVVNAMLAAGAQVDRFDDNAMSPLMWAAKHGHIHIIQTLIHKHKASRDNCNTNNENSLLTACKSKQWGAARMLFDCGVDALCTDKEQNSAVSVALSSHSIDLLQHMVANSYPILTRLKDTMSLSDVCKFGCAMLLTYHNTDSLHTDEICALLRDACSTRQIQILEHFSERLDDKTLVKFITHSCQTKHYDCMDVFVQSAKKKSLRLSCPEILLSETCKDAQCISLTEYLITNGRDIDEGEGEPIRTAVKSNNIKAVQCLLRHNVKLDVADENGFAPLLYACHNKDLGIVNALLKWGADVNFSGKETALTMACKGGSMELVNRLLSNKPSPDLNKPNHDGLTPFEVAVHSNNSVVAVALLTNGASPSFRRVSFEKLCQIGNKDLVNRYIQSCTADNEVIESSGYSLDVLVRSCNVQLVSLILENTKVAKTSEALVQALKTACKVGPLDSVKVLIQYDGGKFWQSVSDPGFLQLALEHCHKDIVDFLIDHGCKLLTEKIPWEAVIRSREILDLLMKRDIGLLMECDISQSCLNQALMVACRSYDRNAEYAVRLLLDMSAQVDHCDTIANDRVTPLLIACQKSSVSLVKLLLERGAFPNHCDIGYKSPLLIACELDNMEIISLLIYDGKADPNIPSMSVEKKPLWEACMKGCLDIAQFLLEHGASPNLRDEEGHFLLFKAHSNGQHEIVRLLLESEANSNTLSGVTLREACQYGYAEYALRIYHHSDFNELIDCLKLAKKHDFEETTLSIIIHIQDQARQVTCFAALRGKSLTSLDKVHTTETTPTTTSSQEGNPLWQCYQNNDTRAMIRLLKEGHDPNIKNTYGRPLLHLWLERKNRHAVYALCECPKLDITQKDNLGRNALFYTLDWHVSINETPMYDFLKAKGAEVVPDKFGRTVLHEWKQDNDGHKREVSLEKLLEDIPEIHICDHKRHTPLHLAVYQEKFPKVCKLLQVGSNPKAQDVNGISPLILACKNPEMRRIFRDRCPGLEIPPVPQVHDGKEKVYFSKDYPMDQRPTSAIYKLFKTNQNQSSVSLFRNQFEESLLISRAPQFKNEFKRFKTSVHEFMIYLSDAIGKDDPLFEFSPVMSGSCSEGTKVVAMDEADVLCVFKHPDWKTLLLETHEEDNYSFMKLESESLSQKHAQIFSGPNLSVHGVFARFYTLVRKHAAEALQHIRNLYIMDVHAILPYDYSICPMDLVWSCELFSWQEFSVDIVPAIPVSKEKVPKGVKYHDFMHDVVVVPKWTSSLIPKSYANQAFQLGFSNTEKDFFYGMPVALREAYKLAKVVKHNCMVIDDVKAGETLSSYMLKCKAFECFVEMPGLQETVKNANKRELIDDEASPPDEVLKLADKLLAKVVNNVEHHRLESFFLGYNLLGQANNRSLIYARLCHAMLHIPSENIRPWTHLAEAVADQLVTPQNLDPETFVQEVDMLLEMKLEVNYKPKNSATILYHMIKNNLLDGVKYLLESKASVDDIDGKGSTAMHVAETNKYTDIGHHLHKTVAGKVILRLFAKL